MERNNAIVWIIVLFFLFFAQPNTAAQELIFEKQIDSTPKHPDFGPNRKHFYHPYFSSSLIFPSSGGSGINTDQPFTGQISLGFRYKFKITKPVALVSECGINRSFFRIGQAEGKNYPDTLVHQLQSIRISGLSGGVFLRVRFGQRGDYLGNYVDLGITGQVSFRNQLVTKDRYYSSDPKGYRIEKTSLSDFQNINPFSYKALVRFGFDRFSLIASYRLSRLLKDSPVKDLPGLEIGIEVSPVRY